MEYGQNAEPTPGNDGPGCVGGHLQTAQIGAARTQEHQAEAIFTAPARRDTAPAEALSPRAADRLRARVKDPDRAKRSSHNRAAPPTPGTEHPARILRPVQSTQRPVLAYPCLGVT